MGQGSKPKKLKTPGLLVPASSEDKGKILTPGEVNKGTPFEGTTFNIVHHRGTPNTAVLTTGQTVERQEYVILPEAPMLKIPRIVKCAPYDNHFVYLDPVEEMGHWFAMCTCGAAAVIVEIDVRTHERMLVCYVHHSSGVHQGDHKWS